MWLYVQDEPTNHLDFPAVLWLEDYLQNYQKTLVVVSHDRNFVNAVITDVIHFHNQTLTFYRGDYETFEKVRMEQQKNQKKVQTLAMLPFRIPHWGRYNVLLGLFFSFLCVFMNVHLSLSLSLSLTHSLSLSLSLSLD